jgi:alpha-ketoglutarate-dependent taurine dioxygenase
MSRSRIAQLSRLCSSLHSPPTQLRQQLPPQLQRKRLLRSFSSSCPIWDGQQSQSILKSKLAAIHDDKHGGIGDEQWFTELGYSPSRSFIPNENEDKPVEKPQREGSPQNEEDSPVWGAMRSFSPRQKAAAMDISGLFRDDGSATLDPIFLRDSCQCGLCIDRSTRQRNFVTAQIPQDIQAIFRGRSDQGRVKVGWKNDIPGYPAQHQSIYSQSQLRTLTSPAPKSAVARRRHHWDRITFEKRASWTKYADFVNDTEAYRGAMTALHRDGLIFISEVKADEQAVARMAERIGPLRNTFYGPTWDVRSVADSKNVAFTNQHLGFHMDLLYMTNPPGIQLLHCLKNSCAGGESRFADAFFAASRLLHVHEQLYKKLAKASVEWTYENDGQFFVQRRPTFQEVSRFIRGDEHARHRLEYRENKYTDADLAYVNWSPPFQGRLLHNPEFPVRTKELVQAMQAFDQILNSDDMVVELKMDEGTCAIFENRRVVHARNAFQLGEGERWFRGAYVDEDAFWSKCRALGADSYDTSSIAQPGGPFVRKYDLASNEDGEVKVRRVGIREAISGTRQP